MNSTDEKFLGAHYHYFKQFLEDSIGIVLGDNKQYLVKSRLSNLLGRYEINDLSYLVDAIKGNKISGLRDKVIDAMTTNETLWFRDAYPFVILVERIFPELLQGKPLERPLRIWSAAASTGQEAYSISISISEFLNKHPHALANGIEIIATDVSLAALEQAKNAEYKLLQLKRGLSSHRLHKFFEKIDEQTYKVKEHIKCRVKFKYLNLLDSYAALGKFDVVFCRNVLIYLSPEVKQRVLKNLSNTINKNGFLCVGGTESLNDAIEYYQMIHCNPGIIYQVK